MILHEFAHMKLHQLDDLQKNSCISKEGLEPYIESMENTVDKYSLAIKDEETGEILEEIV